MTTNREFKTDAERKFNERERVERELAAERREQAIARMRERLSR